MHPEAGGSFFVKELDARVTFVREGGCVTHLRVNWDGRELRVRRLGDAARTAAK